MYAKATFIGRATKNAEACQLPSGKVKADFGIACNPYSKDETCFFDIVAYDTKADFVSKYVTKGKLLYLVCTIRPRSYEDKNGNRRYATDYILQEVKFLSADKPQEEQPIRKPTLTEMYDCDEMPPF
jgi:single-strand DNA-binding protein